jgi:hypothetical protein
VAEIGLVVPSAPGLYDLDFDGEIGGHARGEIQVVRQVEPTSRSSGRETRGSVRIGSTLPQPAVVPPRGFVWVRGTVTNTGLVLWLGRVPGVPVGQVRIGAVWLRNDGTNQPVPPDGLVTRIDLARDVFPGNTLAFDGGFQAPAAPGSYVLKIDAVVEGMTWLHEVDPSDSPVFVPVAVVPTPPR